VLSAEDNNRLTRVAPGTPGGELLRRYWQPVALADELPAGGAPLPVRIMHEDLVLFRDEEGQPGLLGLHCSHRGADLSYGRLEDGGLRCIYHGWLYDTAGHCLEQPGEPAGSTFHERIRQTAYPVREKAGILFAYLGPGEPPLLPAYEFLDVAAGCGLTEKIRHECNYLQGNEGNIDPAHQSFLHRLARDSDDEHGVRQVLNARATAPIIDTEETAFGIRIYAVRNFAPEKNNVRVSNFILPNLCAVAGDKYGYLVQWHVPIDDEHHWRYQLWYRRAVPFSVEDAARAGETLLPDRRMVRNQANRYLQDREEQRDRSFAGLGPKFVVHDACAIEGAGPIQDRTQEHLAYGDRAIVAMRAQLLRALRDVAEGRDPPHVIRDAGANTFPDMVVRRDMVLPSAMDYHGFWQHETPELGETWALIGGSVVG
jgi:phthalate 4,5-dioxygenase